MATKSTNIWKLNNLLLRNNWIKEEIIRENRQYFELNKNEDTEIRICGTDPPRLVSRLGAGSPTAQGKGQGKPREAPRTVGTINVQIHICRGPH